MRRYTFGLVQGKAGDRVSLTVKGIVIKNGKRKEVILTDGVTFRSDNTAVATMDAKGIVRGVSKGKTIIEVKYGELTAKMEVKVSNKKVK